ncbi:MAG: hypothetical protein JKY50_05335 [Oleispira sp.]|nr:hypothetical protein [Oleispira sp.]MBL4882716.1 hypothetical protein [Oleispira sp.]
MAIQNNVTSLLSQLAKQPMTDTARQPSLSQVSDDEPVRSTVSQKSFSGSGLDLELTLASGQEIKLSIRINQAGGLSQLELASDSELSIADQEKLSEFLKQLSSSVADLFKGKSNGSDTFKFANLKGIEDIELNVYQDNGNEKQSLTFDKEGRGSGRKIEALWTEYDRANGVEETHDFSLTKQAKRDDQTAIYGQMNYQWLLDQVDSAMGVMDDKQQGKQLAGFFKSGIQALFSTASSGSQLLQQLGASAQQAKEVIGRSIQILASEHKQMNALPDFNMSFSSQRQTQGSSLNEYQLGMTISQNSDQGKNDQTDESYQTQNRRLRMDYQSARQQAIYEYTWTRDESIRNVFEGGNLASTHYRIEERIQSQLLGEIGSENQLEYKDRDDQYFK